MTANNFESVNFMLNGEMRAIRNDPDLTLLMALRNELDVVSARIGCGNEQCGACLVLCNGKAVHACSTPISEVAGAEIVTLEGLAKATGLHPLQQAFISRNAGQCGYCSNGVLIKAVELLNVNPHPTRQQIQAALIGNLCRCGAHNRMIQAIQDVAHGE